MNVCYKTIWNNNTEILKSALFYGHCTRLWFSYGLAIPHTMWNCNFFFAWFSEVLAKDESEQMETLSIRSGGAGFAV